MFRVTRRRVAAVSLFAAGAVFTSACTGEVGAAAVVDGERIETSTVQEAVDDLAPLSPGFSQSDALTSLIDGPAWIETASDLGMGLSDQEVHEQLEGFAAEAGVEKTEFSDGALDVMRVSLVAGQLLNGPDAERATIEVTELLEDRDIKINPRFGERDPQGGVVPTTPDWLIDSPANPSDDQ